MFGDDGDYSDYSMVSVDPNPTFDQASDGGWSADFSSFVNSASMLGTEIAGAVQGFQGQPSQTPVYPTMPPTIAPKKSNMAQILLVVIVLGGGLWLISSMKPS